MFSTPYARSLWGVGKRVRMSLPTRAFATETPSARASPIAPVTEVANKTESTQATTDTPEQTRPEGYVPIWPETLDDLGKDDSRLPRNVQAIYLRPLKRTPEYGLPTCDLQLRSYSVRNVEFFADFALRAAYYLKLPARGPIPLPRITERWTVPRGNFVHKKSQENFERITLRRLIQIQDGHPEVVQTWLAFLRKHAYHGVGMKANVWEFESLGVSQRMDTTMQDLEEAIAPKMALFGKSKKSSMEDAVANLLETRRFKETGSPLMSLRKL